MASRATVIAAVGALAVLALTACATPAPTPTPTSSSASSTSTATPAPSASSSATAAPAALVVSTAGIGPLKVGRPVPAGTPLVTWKPDVCGQGLGLWSPSEGAGFTIGTRELTERGPITAVQVSSAAIRTPSGLHVGSTKAEVAAALPAAKYHVADVYATADVAWYSVVSGGNRITFSLVGADGARVVDSTEVAYIFVLPATTEDTHFIGTDGVGSCA